MTHIQKHVAVIGGGVTGLTAADELARCGVRVSVVEKSPFLGGQAIQLVCKATDACVKCGACVAEEKLMQASRHGHVRFHTATTVSKVDIGTLFNLHYETHSPLINAERCNGCGICFQKCPVPGTLMIGKTPRLGPYVAIRRELCRFFEHAACTLCRDACPQGAIALSKQSQRGRMAVDGLLIATGFMPFNPCEKPFGYNRFADVITNLDAERILREHAVLKRPSDDAPPGRVAFIQCVGSRDAVAGHPWCSRICCGSSLRMARLVQFRQPETQVTFFYIDVQTFGKDFHHVHEACRKSMDFVRAIPGEILEADSGQLRVVYFDPAAHATRESFFDMVVLSAGMTPPASNADLARMIQWPQSPNGFIQGRQESARSPDGIFIAGSALGPMSIAESIESAGHAVWQMVTYLEKAA